jgi:hypothetical protein
MAAMMRDKPITPKQITISVTVNFEGNFDSARGLGSMMSCAAVELANKAQAHVVECGWMIRREPTVRRNPRARKRRAEPGGEVGIPGPAQQ